MTKTLTAPVDDPKMWRRVLKLTHPDAGGSHETFIWVQAVRESVCDGNHASASSRRHAGTAERTYSGEVSRIPYSPHTNFDNATGEALRYAMSHQDLFASVLQLLEDCYPQNMVYLRREQERGASYKRLAAIGYLIGMDSKERSRWYRIAEAVPLSDRHAGHILSRLKRRAA